MTALSDDHERTMAFANIALSQIKALRQPALPRNYEVWYNYATGYNPSLNQALNEMLAANGGISQADIDRIYDAFLSPTRLTERIDSVGSKVMGEIEQVMSMIDAAVGSATRTSESLAGMTDQLGGAADREGLRAIVEGLVQATKEMEHANHKLEERLKASKLEINELQDNLEVVRTESLTDPLTGLANRKYFDQVLERAISHAATAKESLSLILADIDHFKAFNDTYGHLTGDQVLRLVAVAVKQNIKGQDMAARFGGEELAVVLPNTALQQALTVADHIRCAVMTKDLMKRSTGEHLGRVTISMGVAEIHDGESAQSLIERADTCLYAAKRNGRNRVVCETDADVPPVTQTQVA